MKEEFNLNLTQIQHFISAANHLNFTEAARSLYITQPSLSNSIAALEKELGFELFIRTKKFVRLTPAGSVLYKEFSNLSDQINSSIAKAHQANLGIDGNISIGCLEAIDTSFFLPQIVNNFIGKYPNVGLTFERYSFRALREKLLNGYFDIIFTLSFEINAMPKIQWDTICNSQAIIAVPVSNPLSSRDTITMADIKDETLSIIAPTESAEGAKALLELCNRYNFNPNKIKYCPSLEAMLLYLESGFGVALLDKTIKFNNTSKIKFFDVPIETGIIDIIFAWKDNNFSPSLSLFLNSLLDMPAKDFNLHNNIRVNSNEC